MAAAAATQTVLRRWSPRQVDSDHPALLFISVASRRCCHRCLSHSKRRTHEPAIERSVPDFSDGKMQRFCRVTAPTVTPPVTHRIGKPLTRISRSSEPRGPSSYTNCMSNATNNITVLISSSPANRPASVQLVAHPHLSHPATAAAAAGSQPMDVELFR